MIEKIVGVIKETVNFATESKSAGLKLNNADLTTKLATLTVENQKLKEQIELLQAKKKDPLVFKDGFYYANEDTDNKYPYCSACYEISDLRVHLIKLNLKCPKCNTVYPREQQSPGIRPSRHYTARDVLRGYE